MCIRIFSRNFTVDFSSGRRLLDQRLSSKTVYTYNRQAWEITLIDINIIKVSISMIATIEKVMTKVLQAVYWAGHEYRGNEKQGSVSEKRRSAFTFTLHTGWKKTLSAKTSTITVMTFAYVYYIKWCLNKSPITWSLNWIIKSFISTRVQLKA